MKTCKFFIFTLFIPLFTTHLNAHPVLSLGFGSISTPMTKASIFLEDEQLKFKFSYTQSILGMHYNGQYGSSGSIVPFSTGGFVNILSAGSTIDCVISDSFKIRIGVPFVYTYEYKTRLGAYGSYAPLEILEGGTNTFPDSNASIGAGDLRISALTLAIKETVNTPAIIFTNGFVIPTGRVVYQMYQRETTTGGGNLNLTTGISIAKTYKPISIIGSMNYDLGIIRKDIPLQPGNTLSVLYKSKYNNVLSYSLGMSMPVYYIEEQKSVPKIDGWTGPDTFTVKRPVISAGLVFQSMTVTYSQEKSGTTDYFKEKKSQFGPLLELRPKNHYSILLVMLFDLPSVQVFTQRDFRFGIDYTYYFLKKNK